MGECGLERQVQQTLLKLDFNAHIRRACASTATVIVKMIRGCGCDPLVILLLPLRLLLRLPLLLLMRLRMRLPFFGMGIA